MTIICAFPGVGKSHCFNNKEFMPNVPRVIPKKNEDGKYVPVLKSIGLPIKAGWPVIADSDSTMFPKDDRGVGWVKDYVDYIQYVQENHPHSFQFVSTHADVRKELFDRKLPFICVVPHVSLKDAYIDRYRARGNDNAFIELMQNKFEAFVEDCTKFIPSNSFGVILVRNDVFLSNVANSWNFSAKNTQLRDLLNGTWKPYGEYYLLANSFFNRLVTPDVMVPAQLSSFDPSTMDWATAESAAKEKRDLITEFMPDYPDDHVVIPKNGIVNTAQHETATSEDLNVAITDITVGMVRRAIGDGVSVETIRQKGEEEWFVRELGEHFVNPPVFFVQTRIDDMSKPETEIKSATLTVESY